MPAHTAVIQQPAPAITISQLGECGPTNPNINAMDPMIKITRRKSPTPIFTKTLFTSSSSAFTINRMLQALIARRKLKVLAARDTILSFRINELPAAFALRKNRARCVENIHPLILRHSRSIARKNSLLHLSFA